tara:strand:+ start:290 stop:574 length:285 start_codon:yes stop_codon:yes gene_type:complete
MENQELTIGTKVSYNKVSLKNGDATSLESVVIGFFDGYASLLNGDKMRKQALTFVREESDEVRSLKFRLSCTKNMGTRMLRRSQIQAMIKYENQ